MAQDALPEERLESIRRRLGETGRVSAIALAREFGTSEDTIRRDLRDLAAAGHCRRVYGGALRVSPAGVSLQDRLVQQTGAKAAIAHTAATLVTARQTVFIDTGSTNSALAAALPRDVPLTVVTNAPAVAALLTGLPQCTLVVIGGRVDPTTGGSHGPRALGDLEGVHPDLCFVGACAVSKEHGLAVFDAEEAAFKSRLVEIGGHTVAMATTDKLSTTAPFGFARLDQVGTLVIETEADFDPGAAAPGLRVLRARDGGR